MLKELKILKDLFKTDLIYFQERLDVYSHFLELNHKILNEYESNYLEGMFSKTISLPSELEEKMENYYPLIINSSIYVSVFSFFEFRIKFLAARTEFIKKTKLKHTEINGGNIEVVIRYLEIELGFDKSILKEFSDDLNFYRFIRNKIVHQGGIINLGGKQVNLDKHSYVNKIKKETGIKLNSIGQIEITKREFVDELMNFCLKYYERLNENAT